MAGKVLTEVIYGVRPTPETLKDGTVYYRAFPSDKRNLASALRWAGPKGIQVEHDNSPVSIRIVGIEHRSNGGRAYKALIWTDNMNLMVDLREHQILEILNSGCADGVPNAKFVWMRHAAQTTLVAVGSELYTKHKEPLPPPIKTFQQGHMYGNAYKRFLYIGKSRGYHVVSTYYSTVTKVMTVELKKSIVAREDRGPVKDKVDYEDILEKAFNTSEYWFRYELQN